MLLLILAPQHNHLQAQLLLQCGQSSLLGKLFLLLHHSVLQIINVLNTTVEQLVERLLLLNTSC